MSEENSNDVNTNIQNLRFNLNDKQNKINHKPQLKYTTLERAQILQGVPVAKLDSKVAPKGFNNVTKWVTNIFNQQSNLAINPELGEINLTLRSIRDSLAHIKKPNPYQTITFSAIKDVLAKGGDFKCKS